MSLFGLITICTVVAFLTHEHQPHYGGKSLTYWMDVYSKEYNYEIAGHPRGYEGRDAIRAIGTNALPYLLEWMNYERPRSDSRRTIGKFLLRLPYISRFDSIRKWMNHYAEVDRATLAVKAFGALGRLADPALPELNRRMNTNAQADISYRATIALGQIGESAIPLLSAQLANTNAPNRAQVANVFGWFPALATNDSSVVPMLVTCLDAPDTTLHRNAALALARIAEFSQPNPDLVIPILTNQLRAVPGQDTIFHSGLLLALAAYGEKARGAVPLLQQMAVDQTDWVRVKATNALMKIAPEVLTTAPAQ